MDVGRRERYESTILTLAVAPVQPLVSLGTLHLPILNHRVCCEESKQCGTPAAEPATSVLPSFCAPYGEERVPRSALDGPLMTPRTKGKMGAATFPKQCLLLLGRCQNGEPEVLPVLHIYHCVTSAPHKPAWIARWHITRGIRVKGMTEILDKTLK